MANFFNSGAMKLYIFIFLFLTSYIVSGQDYLSLNKDYIKGEYPLADNSYYIISETSKKLLISKRGENKIETLCFFNSKIGKEKICDSIIIKYYCCDCFESETEELLQNKKRKWKKSGAGKYISNKKVKNLGYPVIVIEKVPGDVICGRIYLYFSATR